MKKVILVLLSLVSHSALAQSFAPSGVYVTSGFQSGSLNNRVLVCDYSNQLEDTWCRVIDQSAKAVIKNVSVVIQDESKNNYDMGILTGAVYSASLGQLESGSMHQVMLEKANIFYKTKYTFSWEKIDSNADILIPRLEKSTKVKLTLVDENGDELISFGAVGGVYQY